MSESTQGNYLEGQRIDTVGNKQYSQLISAEPKAPWRKLGIADFRTTSYEFNSVTNQPGNSSETMFSIVGDSQDSPFRRKTFHVDRMSKSDRGNYFIKNEHIDPKKSFQDSCELASEKKQDIIATYLDEDKLQIANHGNFQAVLGRDGYAESLTEYVPPEEEVNVTEHILPQGESQLIMGSAGLWNFMTPEEATKLIAQVKNPEEASILLRQEAYKRAQLKDGTVGDISVMVVNLNVPEKGVTSLSDRRTRKATRPYGRMAA